MTKNLRYIFILLAMLMATQLFAQNPNYQGGVWYSLYDTEDDYRTSKGDFPAKTIFTPAESMTFQYKKLTGISINGNIEVKNYIINSGWSGSKETVKYSSTSWTTSSTIPLDSAISQVRCTMTSGNGGQVRNHFVKLRKHILLNNGTSYGTTSLSAGNQTNLATSIGVRSTNAYTIPLRSFYTTKGQITITSSNPEFHFSNGSASKTFTLPTTNFCASASYIGNPGNNWQDISNFQEKIYFTPTVNIKGDRSTTITISDGTNKATFTLSAPVIPTYYFYAAAIAYTTDSEGNTTQSTLGGSAVATFNNGHAQTTYSVKADDYTTASITQSATYTATPNTEGGYVFDGWKASPDATDYVSRNLTMTPTTTTPPIPTITSSALSIPTTPQQTYYAMFVQKYNPEITGTTSYTKMVDDIWDVDFNFINTETTTPEDAKLYPNASFVYEISNDFNGNEIRKQGEENTIITYNPNTNKITAHNAGTATLTIIQKGTSTHNEKIFTCTITVSKYNTNLSLDLQDSYFVDDEDNHVFVTNNPDVTVQVSDKTADNRALFTYDNGILKANGATLKADTETTTITIYQPESYKWTGKALTKDVIVKKYPTDFTWLLNDTYYVDDVITEIFTKTNNSLSSTITSSDPNIVKVEGNQLKALNAGKVTITVSQAVDRKWVAFTKTKEITILKHNIVATINPDNAVWNQLVTPNPFSATSTHPVSGHITKIDNFNVAQQGNEHIALMDANTRNIQTYYTNGDVNFLITRPEDYKYNALSQTLTLHVKQSTVNCPVLEDNDKREWSTINNSGTYTILNGTPDSLFFQAQRTPIWGVTNSSDFYAQYKTADGEWTRAMTINLENKDTWYNLSCDIPDNAKYIRFITETGATGNKHIQNVRVTRKKSLTPSESPVILNVTSIGTPESKTFTLNWSTCAEEIKLMNSNPHFTLDKYTISPTNNQGSTTITVTCDAAVVGTLRDTIVIYDQTQRIFVPVECVVNDKFIANIKGTTAYSKKVDDTWVADFKFDTCQTTLPSAESNAPFYYTISNDLTGNDVQNLEYKDQVISYNPQNNTITAHNAGTAILTFIQKPTISHYTDTFRCVITVSKHDVELQWKDPVYFNDTVYNYFTTTNTTSHIDIVSQTDNDVAKLTNEFNPTSNNSLDLITFNKEASTTVTVSQAETYYWNAYSEPHTITPIDQNNHVTFTLTEDNYINVFQKAYDDPWAGSNGPNWSNGGIRFGDNGITSGDGGWNWNDKYIIIEFTGIPDTLTFTTTTDGSATTGEITDGLFFYVAEKSPTQSEFTEIWNSTEQSNNVALKLNPDTRFIKLCYTGNLRGWFKNVKVTELNQFEARPDVLDFGLQYVDNPPAIKTFDFHYANAGYKVNLESTDPHFTLSTTYINTIGGEKYGIVKDIQVTYTPSEVHNAHDTEAKILIWDEIGNRDTVFLTASTVKSTPTLYWTQAWSATEPIVLLDQTVTNAAASTNGYSTVKYYSSNENKIRITNNGTAFEGIDTGRVVITAYQEPDRAYNAPAEISKTFIVTDKIAQYIVWEDNLTNLRIGDAPVTLTAQVWVMTDAATNTWEYSPEQTAKLQYSSPDSAIVSVASNSNILNINGVGELMLEAFILADSTYEYAHAQVPVRVRDQSSTCTDEDLIIPVKQNGNLLNLADKLEYDPYLRKEEHVVEIDTTQGVPGELIFGYYGREAWWQLSGRIRVYESTDGGNSYRQILSDADAVTPLNQELQYSPRIPLSRNATHIKFQRFESVNMGYHLIQYITVLPAKYIDAEDVYWGNIYLGNTPDTTITFDYSSVRGDMEFSTSHTNLRVSPSTISKECGDWGSEQLTITLVADINVIGDFHEQVYIYDKVGNISDTINVYATIIKNNPTITWETTLDTIRSSAEWETQKTAFASSGDQVHYELTAGNQMDEYAYLNDNGKMILLRGGMITARAYTVETNISNEVSEYRQFFILVDPLFENTDNDQDWLNDNNWNIGRTPWLTDSATIQAGKTVILSTHVTTQGLEFQANSSIQITSTGGLTVGAHGITGAATDGSSLIIDNLKTGAGFLRISPEYTGAMPKVTMRYQTRSTLDTGANKDATWQYMGAPGANCQFTVDYITWLYQWSEPYNWQQKSGTLTLEPFAGYAITQYGQPTYELTAEAITADRTITLTRTPNGMDGNNLFANSYMAPIDVKNFTEEDFSGDLDKTFYIFNSGSWNQWNGQNEKDSTIGGNGSTTPGQYCAIPALSAPYLDSEYDITTIPPMQGVYVIAYENDAKIHLNYNKHVWQAGNDTDASTSTNMNEAMRAPQRKAQEQMLHNDFRRLRLQVNSANSGADRLYIIQENTTTSDYDNGYDAPNQFADGIANIYTTEHFGKMEVSCSNHIDSMYIGFQAGNDSAYTLSYHAIIGEEIYLKDLSNDSTFLLIEGEQYQFVASPFSTNDLRFQVLLHIDNEEDTTPDNGGVTTDIDNVAGAHIWHNNNHIYISNATANSTLALYTINGQLILSTNIPHTTHTVDLNYLPQGVYLLQLGCQMYKFVRQ